MFVYRFHNGPQPALTPEAAGPRYGSVLGCWRPWCPPEFIRKFRAAFPNGLAGTKARGAMTSDDLLELLSGLGQESLQNMVEGGFVFGDLEGAEVRERTCFASKCVPPARFVLQHVCTATSEHARTNSF